MCTAQAHIFPPSYYSSPVSPSWGVCGVGSQYGTLLWDAENCQAFPSCMIGSFLGPPPSPIFTLIYPHIVVRIKRTVNQHIDEAITRCMHIFNFVQDSCGLE